MRSESNQTIHIRIRIRKDPKQFDVGKHVKKGQINIFWRLFVKKNSEIEFLKKFSFKRLPLKLKNTRVWLVPVPKN